MNVHEKFKEQLKKKSKVEMVKQMIMSFTVTVTAVVAVVVFVPKSPVAAFRQVRAFSDSIAYQVFVTDEDNTISDSGLVVILENQMEYYEQPISLGLSSGAFLELKPNTDYTLTVRYDKGFGAEKLATRRIKTTNLDGAAFVGVSIVDPNYDYWIPYELTVYFQNENLTYQDATLYFANISPYDTSDPFYESYPVELGNNRFTFEVENENTRVHAYIEASTSSGTTILDEIEFYTPLSIYAFAYVTQITPSSFGLSFYLESQTDVDIHYQIIVKLGSQVIQTLDLPKQDPSSHQSDSLFEIKNLRSETTYTLELHATYTDPITLKKETRILETFEETTLPKFTYTLDIKDMGSYLEVKITVNDPGHNYQLSTYTITQEVDGITNYLYSGESPFYMIDNVKQTSFTIDLTYQSPYVITIGLASERDYRYTIDLKTLKK